MRALRKLRQLIPAARNDDVGAAMLEYAFLAAGIAVVVGVAAAALGGRLVTMFGTFFP